MTNLVSVVIGGIYVFLIWSIIKPVSSISILSSRKKAVFTLMTFFMLSSIITGIAANIKEESNKKNDELKRDCDGVPYNDLVAPAFRQVLYVLPNKSSKKLINEKSTSIMGHVEYYQVDRTETVRRLCVLSEWSKIKIESPSYLSDVTGWVPNNALREIKWDKDGYRIYIERDISWDDDTKKYKNKIVSIINRISRENEQCKALDTASVLRSTKSTKNKPLFFVTCYDSRELPFNVFFNPDEYLMKKSFSALKPISQEAATEKCEQVAKLSATHPSTVDFSRVWSLSFNTFPTGRARVDTTFTAKNAFNVSFEYNISCLFEGNELIEKNIYEKR